MGIAKHSGLFLRALLQPVCATCNQPLSIDSSDSICDDCRATLALPGEMICKVCGDALLPDEIGPDRLCLNCDRRPPAYSYLRSATDYSRVASTLVKRLKYGKRLDLVPFLAEFMIAAYWRYFAEEEIDLIAPIPLHWWRGWRRGFNQAELLGESLAREVRVEFSNEALMRTRRVTPQARLSMRERRKNLDQAFGVLYEGMVRDKRILLIDDVATTGTTFHEAAAALRASGARQVFCLSFARAYGGNRRAPSKRLKAKATAPDV